ncbi:hypothetical protein OCAR_4067 [Afipia carboxidovorans OM5]|nr:hypothetical protein OCAR_4067 [Afipia carboxidovorans OM5]
MCKRPEPLHDPYRGSDDLPLHNNPALKTGLVFQGGYA